MERKLYETTCERCEGDVASAIIQTKYVCQHCFKEIVKENKNKRKEV